MDIYLQTFIWFLIVGSIGGIVVGTLLFFQPETVANWGKVMNKWVSTRRALRSLEIPRNNTDSFVLRYPKAFGIIVLVLSVITFYKLWIAAPLETLWHPTAISVVFGWGIEVFIASLRLFFLIGTAFTAVMGLMILIDTERFKKLSTIANRWISSRLALLPLEKMYYDFDVFVMRKNRFFGAFMVLGSVYTLIALIQLIRQ